MPTQALLSNQSNFLRKLANDVYEAAKPIRITAEEVLDPGDTTELTLDDAIQRAQGLWLSGYTWDEIEIRLIDMEFPENVAKKAVTKTKEYAKEKLNEGPFSTPLIEGQTARLKNGSTVIVEAVSPKQVTVSDGEELYTVTVKQIDRYASLELKEAYLMRVAARQLLRDAQAKYKEPDLGEGSLVPKVPDKSTMKVVPKIQDLYEYKQVKKTPEGLTELTPEQGDAPPLPEQLARILNDISGLQELRDELHAKTQKIKEEQLDSLNQQYKELGSDQKASLKNAFLVNSQINRAIAALDSVVFYEYEGQVLALQSKTIEKRPGTQDELDALKEILTKNHPKIAREVLATLEVYMKATENIEYEVEHIMSLFPYRKHPLKKKESLKVNSQLLEKIKKFFKSIVERVTAVTNRLFDKTIPLTEETTDALKAFNKKVATASNKVRINAAISSLSRRRK